MIIGDVAEPMAGVLPEPGPGSRPRRSAQNLSEPVIPAMAATINPINDLPDEIWMPSAGKKLVILDEIGQGNWEQIQDIRKTMAPANHIYHAPEEQPKVPRSDDYERCLRNMEFIQEFHDDKIGARAPSEDLGEELERLSETSENPTPRRREEV